MSQMTSNQLDPIVAAKLSRLIKRKNELAYIDDLVKVETKRFVRQMYRLKELEQEAQTVETKSLLIKQAEESLKQFQNRLKQIEAEYQLKSK